ncbi:MAG: nitroreductase family protein [Oscillospiraceae bacterium]|jgi:nitroreductase|nr:nitroreductase family protein [Oscillospiraceae bacterium]
MTVSEAIRTRRSVRKYEARAVEDEKLVAVLEAARLAPSAANGQNWRFILVRDAELIVKLCAASEGMRWAKDALPPAIIVVAATATRQMACGEQTGAMDASIAMSFMLLQAHELGLGTCWLGNFFADKVRGALDLPQDLEIVAVTPIGYPAETPEARPRKPFEDVVSFDGI